MTFNAAPDYDNNDIYYGATVTVSDGDNSTTQAISILINDLNDESPSITSSASFSADENQTSIGTVTATDVDTDDSSISFSISGSDITIDSSTGVMTFNSTPDYESGDFNFSATVTASDGVNTTTQVITVSINEIDDENPNITSSSTFNIDENEITIGTITATDADTDDSSISFSISGSDISIDSSTGVMTFNSAPDYETQTSISATVTASDGTNSSTQEITISLNDLDDTAPVFTSSAAFSADENQSAIGTVTATDVDTDDSSISFSISGSDISIDSSTGVMTFNSAPDYESQTSYSATVTATDGSNSETQLITVSINNLNDNTPEIIDFSSLIDSGITIPENQQTISIISANDADGDDLTYSIASMSEIGNNNDAALMDINSVSGLLSFNTPPDYENPLDYNTGNNYLVRITVSDGEYSHTIDTTVYVVDIDDEAPIFTSSSTFAVDENETAIGTVTASDVDSDTWTYYTTSSDISINSSTGVMTFNSAPDYETKTSYSAIVIADDGTNSSAQHIDVSINDLDDTGPTFTSNASFNADENQTSIGTVTATDVDSDDSLISFSISGSDIAINSTSGVISFISAPDYESQTSYSATVTATDGSNSDTQLITVSVNNLNDNSPSLISSGSYTINENETTVGYAEGTDLDGDTLTFSLIAIPSPISGEQYSGITIGESSGLIELSGDGADYEERTSLNTIVIVSDGENSSAQGITINIGDVDDEAPTFTSSSSFTVDENQAVIGTVTATDVDTDDSLITYSIPNITPGTNTNNAFPEDSDSSLDETDFYILSPNEDQTVLLKVSNIDNSMNISLKDSNGVLQHQATQGRSGSTSIIINDYLSFDGSTIEFELTNYSDGFTFTWELFVDGQLTYTNSCGINGLEGCAGNSLSTGVVYQASIYLGQNNDNVEIDSDTGDLTFVSPPDYETQSTYSIQVSATDGTNSSTQDITININDVNDAPSFSSTSLAIDENHTSNESIGFLDISDDDNDTISYSISGGADQNLITIDAQTGSLTLDHSPDYENPIDANADNIYELTIEATDGSLTTTENINIHVKNSLSASMSGFPKAFGPYKLGPYGRGALNFDVPNSCIVSDCNDQSYYSLGAVNRSPYNSAGLESQTLTGIHTNFNDVSYLRTPPSIWTDIATAKPYYESINDNDYYLHKIVASTQDFLVVCNDYIGPGDHLPTYTSCGFNLFNSIYQSASIESGTYPTIGQFVEISEDGNTIAVSSSNNSIYILRALSDDMTGGAASSTWNEVDNWIFIGQIDDVYTGDEDFHLSEDGNRILVHSTVNEYLAVYEYHNDTWTQVGDDIVVAISTSNNNISMNLDGTVVGTVTPTTGKVYIFEENNNEWASRVDPFETINNCCVTGFDMDIDGNVIAVGYSDAVMVKAYNGYDQYETIATYSLAANGLSPTEGLWQFQVANLRISSHSNTVGTPINSSHHSNIYILTGYWDNDGEIPILGIEWNED